jgi:predicted exporter
MASERVTTRLAALVTAGVIAGFDSPSQILPSEATQRDRLAALPDDATLRDRLTEALQGLPLRADAFAPFLADVAAARATPLLQRADLDGTGFGLQLDALLLQHPASWSALLPLRGVTDATALASAIASLDLPGLVFLDLRRESDNLLASYRAEALTLSAIGGLAIVLLLVAALREPRRIAAVLLPLVAAVLSTAALVTADGARLSIFNLFGLLLVVAVGSNYCLFFERHDGGQTRMVASLVLADLCTVIGFGILAFSQVPVLHGIGGTVAIGACLSLMFGAVLSPKRP